MLRKSFLIIGIVLLVLGFFFFYLASRINYDYVTTHSDTANLANSTFVGDFYSKYGYPQWGNCYDYLVRGDIIMQLNDVVTVRYPESGLNGTIHIALMRVTLTPENTSVVASSDSDVLTFTSNQPYVPSQEFDVDLAFENAQNVTVPVTTQLHHYETPQWVYFGIGVVLSSLAMIPIFKSKK
jgi:hypothetical protein